MLTMGVPYTGMSGVPSLVFPPFQYGCIPAESVRQSIFTCLPILENIWMQSALSTCNNVCPLLIVLAGFLFPRLRPASLLTTSAHDRHCCTALSADVLQSIISVRISWCLFLNSRPWSPIQGKQSTHRGESSA